MEETEDRIELVLLAVASCCIGGGVLGGFLYVLAVLARSSF